MTEINIKIKYNKGEVTLKEFTLLSDMTIDELRLIVEEEFKIPSYKQNLIYRGKMLQNEKKLEDYNISNNDIILLIEKIGEEKEKVGLNGVTGQTGVGAVGQINYDLLKRPMAFGGDINQMIEALKMPEVQGHLESMMEDPNVIDAMMQNPQIKAMLDLNPGMRNLFMDKEFMRSMLNPENLEALKNIREGNLNPLFNNQNFQNLLNLRNNNNNFNFNNPGFNFFRPPMMMGMGQNNFFNPPNTNANLNKEQLKEKYKNEIKAINDMGFDNEEKIINALQKTNGNINASIERLINNLN